MPESEEEQAAVMAAWGAWYEGLGAAASGYSVLEAGSMDSAISLAKRCPILEGDGQITIYETFEIKSLHRTGRDTWSVTVIDIVDR